MEKAVLNATLRTLTGKKVSTLRTEGKLPAVIYGHHFDATPITLDLKETARVLHGLTASSLVYINLEGKEHAALVREKQRDFLRNVLKHVDFQVVSLTEKIRAKVSIVLEGVSPAVKDFNGVIDRLPRAQHIDVTRIGLLYPGVRHTVGIGDAR